MANLNRQVPIVVVYRKRKKGKLYLEVFDNLRVDDIIDGNKRKPPIPHNYEIVDIGVGTSFIKKFREKYL